MSIESMMPSNHLILCCILLCPQSFPASGSFPVSLLFTSDGQIIGASTSVLPMNSNKKDFFFKCKSLSHVRLFVTPWSITLQAPLSIEFSKREQWSGQPFPSPRDLPNPGIEPRSPALQADCLLSKPPRFRVDFLQDCLISLQSRRLFSSTTVQKHQFFGLQPSLQFNSHICT